MFYKTLGIITCKTIYRKYRCPILPTAKYHCIILGGYLGKQVQCLVCKAPMTYTNMKNGTEEEWKEKLNIYNRDSHQKF